MSQLNLLISHHKRKHYFKESGKIKILSLVVIAWLLYLVFAFIQVQIFTLENRSFKVEVDELSKKSSNQKLINQISLLEQKLIQIKTIEQDNQTKKIALQEIEKTISRQAEIESIYIQTLEEQKIELSIRLKLEQNQSSSELIETLKENNLFSEVSIDSSSSLNGIKQIDLKILIQTIQSK